MEHNYFFWAEFIFFKKGESRFVFLGGKFFFLEEEKKRKERSNFVGYQMFLWRQDKVNVFLVRWQKNGCSACHCDAPSSFMFHFVGNDTKRREEEILIGYLLYLSLSTFFWTKNNMIFFATLHALIILKNRKSPGTEPCWQVSKWGKDFASKKKIMSHDHSVDKKKIPPYLIR